MATHEQTVLSDFIKSIHKKLRQEAQILGTGQAWKNHCNDTENLDKYAKAMRELAVNYWDENSKRDSKVVSRIMWIYVACKEYFQEIVKYRNKEEKIAKEWLEYGKNFISDIPFKNISGVRYNVLDVGSCYNPFRQFKDFEVLAIDIAPANAEVFKCDFLNLDISDSLLIEDRSIKNMPGCFFDVVVFSLLLEYLPTPELRLKCCLNAYNVLKSEGILVIVTPDSNHVGSNSKIIKSWRYILAKDGFTRVKYEKLPYFHSMVFRKAPIKAVAQRWADVHASEGFFNAIYIPQDFRETKLELEEEKN